MELHHVFEGRVKRLEEFVGFCSECGKPIHCLNGFLNGVDNKENGTLHCFTCYNNNDPKAIINDEQQV
jgi:hypothetical protein